MTQLEELWKKMESVVSAWVWAHSLGHRTVQVFSQANAYVVDLSGWPY